MMIRQLIAGAAALAFGISAAAAQAPQAGTAQRQGEPVAATAPAANEVTLVGCVEFEQDYRKRMAAGRGGVLGTGVGASDEFVLTNVRPASAEVGTSGSAPAADASADPAAPGAAASTAPAEAGPESPAGAGGGVYTLTGPQEKNLKRDVGRQIEVVGVIENAGRRSTGADLTDISDLPRIAISTWHPVGDFCPAK